jgi:hypothetical protein
MAGGFLSGLGKVLDADAASTEHVNFAKRALGAAPHERSSLLVQYTRGLTDASFAGFKVSLAMLAGNEQDGARRTTLEQLLDDADAARRGQAAAPVAASGARLAGAAAKPTSPSPAPAGRRPDTAAIEQAMREFTRTGHYPGGIDKLKADVTDLILSGEGDDVMAILEAAGGKEGGDEVLNIKDHYRPGDGRLFELRWPVEFPLPLPFARLDRPTQFSVLWGEYSRRMLEGSQAVLDGDPGQAHAIYAECLERAQQLDVPELIARSHEGIARAAAKGNQRSEERKHLKLAIAARQRE